MAVDVASPPDPTWFLPGRLELTTAERQVELGCSLLEFVFGQVSEERESGVRAVTGTAVATLVRSCEGLVTEDFPTSLVDVKYSEQKAHRRLCDWDAFFQLMQTFAGLRFPRVDEAEAMRRFKLKLHTHSGVPRFLSERDTLFHAYINRYAHEMDTSAPWFKQVEHVLQSTLPAFRAASGSDARRRLLTKAERYLHFKCDWDLRLTCQAAHCLLLHQLAKGLASQDTRDGTDAVRVPPHVWAAVDLAAELAYWDRTRVPLDSLESGSVSYAVIFAIFSASVYDVRELPTQPVYKQALLEELNGMRAAGLPPLVMDELHCTVADSHAEHGVRDGVPQLYTTISNLDSLAELIVDVSLREPATPSAAASAEPSSPSRVRRASIKSFSASMDAKRRARWKRSAKETAAALVDGSAVRVGLSLPTVAWKTDGGAAALLSLPQVRAVGIGVRNHGGSKLQVIIRLVGAQREAGDGACECVADRLRSQMLHFWQPGAKQPFVKGSAADAYSARRWLCHGGPAKEARLFSIDAPATLALRNGLMPALRDLTQTARQFEPALLAPLIDSATRLTMAAALQPDAMLALPVMMQEMLAAEALLFVDTAADGEPAVKEAEAGEEEKKEDGGAVAASSSSGSGSGSGSSGSDAGHDAGDAEEKTEEKEAAEQRKQADVAAMRSRLMTTSLLEALATAAHCAALQDLLVRDQLQLHRWLSTVLSMLQQLEALSPAAAATLDAAVCLGTRLLETAWSERLARFDAPEVALVLLPAMQRVQAAPVTAAAAVEVLHDMSFKSTIAKRSDRARQLLTALASSSAGAYCVPHSCALHICGRCLRLFTAAVDWEDTAWFRTALWTVIGNLLAAAAATEWARLRDLQKALLKEPHCILQNAETGALQPWLMHLDSSTLTNLSTRRALCRAIWFLVKGNRELRLDLLRDRSERLAPLLAQLLLMSCHEDDTVMQSSLGALLDLAIEPKVIKLLGKHEAAVLREAGGLDGRARFVYRDLGAQLMPLTWLLYQLLHPQTDQVEEGDLLWNDAVRKLAELLRSSTPAALAYLMLATLRASLQPRFLQPFRARVESSTSAARDIDFLQDGVSDAMLALIKYAKEGTMDADAFSAAMHSAGMADELPSGGVAAVAPDAPVAHGDPRIVAVQLLTQLSGGAHCARLLMGEQVNVFLGVTPLLASRDMERCVHTLRFLHRFVAAEGVAKEMAHIDNVGMLSAVLKLLAYSHAKEATCLAAAELLAALFQRLRPEELDRLGNPTRHRERNLISSVDALLVSRRHKPPLLAASAPLQKAMLTLLLALLASGSNTRRLLLLDSLPAEADACATRICAIIDVLADGGGDGDGGDGDDDDAGRRRAATSALVLKLLALIAASSAGAAQVASATASSPVRKKAVLTALKGSLAASSSDPALFTAVAELLSQAFTDRSQLGDFSGVVAEERLQALLTPLRHHSAATTDLRNAACVLRLLCSSPAIWPQLVAPNVLQLLLHAVAGLQPEHAGVLSILADLLHVLSTILALVAARDGSGDGRLPSSLPPPSLVAGDRAAQAVLRALATWEGCDAPQLTLQLLRYCVDFREGDTALSFTRQQFTTFAECLSWWLPPLLAYPDADPSRALEREAAEEARRVAEEEEHKAAMQPLRLPSAPLRSASSESDIGSSLPGGIRMLLHMLERWEYDEQLLKLRELKALPLNCLAALLSCERAPLLTARNAPLWSAIWLPLSHASAAAAAAAAVSSTAASRPRSRSGTEGGADSDLTDELAAQVASLRVLRNLMLTGETCQLLQRNMDIFHLLLRMLLEEGSPRRLGAAALSLLLRAHRLQPTALQAVIDDNSHLLTKVRKLLLSEDGVARGSLWQAGALLWLLAHNDALIDAVLACWLAEDGSITPALRSFMLGLDFVGPDSNTRLACVQALSSMAEHRRVLHALASDRTERSAAVLLLNAIAHESDAAGSSVIPMLLLLQKLLAESHAAHTALTLPSGALGQLCRWLRHSLPSVRAVTVSCLLEAVKAGLAGVRPAIVSQAADQRQQLFPSLVKLIADSDSRSAAEAELKASAPAAETEGTELTLLPVGLLGASSTALPIGTSVRFAALHAQQQLCRTAARVLGHLLSDSAVRPQVPARQLLQPLLAVLRLNVPASLLTTVLRSLTSLLDMLMEGADGAPAATSAAASTADGGADASPGGSTDSSASRIATLPPAKLLEELLPSIVEAFVWPTAVSPGATERHAPSSLVGFSSSVSSAPTHSAYADSAGASSVGGTSSVPLRMKLAVPLGDEDGRDGGDDGDEDTVGEVEVDDDLQALCDDVDAVEDGLASADARRRTEDLVIMHSSMLELLLCFCKQPHAWLAAAVRPLLRFVQLRLLRLLSIRRLRRAAAAVLAALPMTARERHLLRDAAGLDKLLDAVTAALHDGDGADDAMLLSCLAALSNCVQRCQPSLNALCAAGEPLVAQMQLLVDAIMPATRMAAGGDSSGDEGEGDRDGTAAAAAAAASHGRSLDAQLQLTELLMQLAAAPSVVQLSGAEGSLDAQAALLCRADQLSGEVVEGVRAVYGEDEDKEGEADGGSGSGATATAAGSALAPPGMPLLLARASSDGDMSGRLRQQLQLFERLLGCLRLQLAAMSNQRVLVTRGGGQQLRQLASIVLPLQAAAEDGQRMLLPALRGALACVRAVVCYQPAAALFCKRELYDELTPLVAMLFSLAASRLPRIALGAISVLQQLVQLADFRNRLDSTHVRALGSLLCDAVRAAHPLLPGILCLLEPVTELAAHQLWLVSHCSSALVSILAAGDAMGVNVLFAVRVLSRLVAVTPAARQLLLAKTQKDGQPLIPLLFKALAPAFFASARQAALAAEQAMMAEAMMASLAAAEAAGDSGGDAAPAADVSFLQLSDVLPSSEWHKLQTEGQLEARAVDEVATLLAALTADVDDARRDARSDDSLSAGAMFLALDVDPLPLLLQALSVHVSEVAHVHLLHAFRDCVRIVHSRGPAVLLPSLSALAAMFAAVELPVGAGSQHVAEALVRCLADFNSKPTWAALRSSDDSLWQSVLEQARQCLASHSTSELQRQAARLLASLPLVESDQKTLLQKQTAETLLALLSSVELRLAALAALRTVLYRFADGVSTLLRADAGGEAWTGLSQVRLLTLPSHNDTLSSAACEVLRELAREEAGAAALLSHLRLSLLTPLIANVKMSEAAARGRPLTLRSSWGVLARLLRLPEALQMLEEEGEHTHLRALGQAFVEAQRASVVEVSDAAAAARGNWLTYRSGSEHAEQVVAASLLGDAASTAAGADGSSGSGDEGDGDGDRDGSGGGSGGDGGSKHGSGSKRGSDASRGGSAGSGSAARWAAVRGSAALSDDGAEVSSAVLSRFRRRLHLPVYNGLHCVAHVLSSAAGRRLLAQQPRVLLALRRLVQLHSAPQLQMTALRALKLLAADEDCHFALAAPAVALVEALASLASRWPVEDVSLPVVLDVLQVLLSLSSGSVDVLGDDISAAVRDFMLPGWLNVSEEAVALCATRLLRNLAMASSSKARRLLRRLRGVAAEEFGEVVRAVVVGGHSASLPRRAALCELVAALVPAAAARSDDPLFDATFALSLSRLLSADNLQLRRCATQLLVQLVEHYQPVRAQLDATPMGLWEQTWQLLQVTAGSEAGEVALEDESGAAAEACGDDAPPAIQQLAAEQQLLKLLSAQLREKAAGERLLADDTRMQLLDALVKQHRFDNMTPAVLLRLLLAGRGMTYEQRDGAGDSDSVGMFDVAAAGGARRGSDGGVEETKEAPPTPLLGGIGLPKRRRRSSFSDETGAGLSRQSAWTVPHSSSLRDSTLLHRFLPMLRELVTACLPDGSLGAPLSLLHELACFALQLAQCLVSSTMLAPAVRDEAAATLIVALAELMEHAVSDELFDTELLPAARALSLLLTTDTLAQAVHRQLAADVPPSLQDAMEKIDSVQDDVQPKLGHLLLDVVMDGAGVPHLASPSMVEDDVSEHSAEAGLLPAAYSQRNAQVEAARLLTLLAFSLVPPDPMRPPWLLEESREFLDLLTRLARSPWERVQRLIVDFYISLPRGLLLELTVREGAILVSLCHSRHGLVQRQTLLCIAALLAIAQEHAEEAAAKLKVAGDGRRGRRHGIMLRGGSSASMGSRSVASGSSSSLFSSRRSMSEHEQRCCSCSGCLPSLPRLLSACFHRGSTILPYSAGLVKRVRVRAMSRKRSRAYASVPRLHRDASRRRLSGVPAPSPTVTSSSLATVDEAARQKSAARSPAGDKAASSISRKRSSAAASSAGGAAAGEDGASPAKAMSAAESELQRLWKIVLEGELLDALERFLGGAYGALAADLMLQVIEYAPESRVLELSKVNIAVLAKALQITEWHSVFHVEMLNEVFLYPLIATVKGSLPVMRLIDVPDMFGVPSTDGVEPHYRKLLDLHRRFAKQFVRRPLRDETLLALLEHYISFQRNYKLVHDTMDVQVGRPEFREFAERRQEVYSYALQMHHALSMVAEAFQAISESLEEADWSSMRDSALETVLEDVEEEDAATAEAVADGYTARGKDSAGGRLMSYVRLLEGITFVQLLAHLDLQLVEFVAHQKQLLAQFFSRSEELVELVEAAQAAGRAVNLALVSSAIMDLRQGLLELVEGAFADVDYTSNNATKTLMMEERQERARRNVDDFVLPVVSILREPSIARHLLSALRWVAGQPGRPKVPSLWLLSMPKLPLTGQPLPERVMGDSQRADMWYALTHGMHRLPLYCVLLRSRHDTSPGSVFGLVAALQRAEGATAVDTLKKKRVAYAAGAPGGDERRSGDLEEGGVPAVRQMWLADKDLASLAEGSLLLTDKQRDKVEKELCGGRSMEETMASVHKSMEDSREWNPFRKVQERKWLATRTGQWLLQELMEVYAFKQFDNVTPGYSGAISLAGAVLPVLFMVVLPALLPTERTPPTVMNGCLYLFFVFWVAAIGFNVYRLSLRDSYNRVDRQPKVRWKLPKYYENWLAVISMVTDFVQQSNFSFRDPETFGEVPSQVLPVLTLDISGFTTEVDTLVDGFYASVFLVAMWVLVLKFANQLSHRGSGATGRFFAWLNGHVTYTLPPILSSWMFVGIIKSLLSVMDCTVSRSQPELAFLDAREETLCWTLSHRLQVMVALLALGAYVPTATLVPFQVLFPTAELDIQNTPILTMVSQLLKFFSLVIFHLFTAARAAYLGASLLMHLSLSVLLMRMPCSTRPWVDSVKRITYTASAWSVVVNFIFLLFATPTYVNWALLAVGWLGCLIALLAVWRRDGAYSRERERLKEKRTHDRVTETRSTEISRRWALLVSRLRFAKQPGYHSRRMAMTSYDRELISRQVSEEMAREEEELERERLQHSCASRAAQAIALRCKSRKGGKYAAVGSE